jgi:hypothetical protein
MGEILTRAGFKGQFLCFFKKQAKFPDEKSMDQAKKIPKVLLLRQTYSEEESGTWLRLFKALKGFSQAELEIRDEPLNPTDIQEISANFDHVIADIALIDAAAFGEQTIPNLIFAAKDTFEWDNPDFRARLMPVLNRHPSLMLEQLSAGDLIRVLHLQFMPKRLAGVVPVMEKGSVIVAEKIQSTDGIGTLIDKLCVYFGRTEGFALKERLPDLRQVLSAVLLEAYCQAKTTGSDYPTVDFQVGMNKGKIAVNLRFPRGKLVMDDIPALAMNGLDPLWHQAWACSDLLLLTEHTQYDEIELLMLFVRPERRQHGEFRSFLIKKSDRSSKKENLFVSSQNYDFHVLSDIRLKEKEEFLFATEEEDTDLDINSLPVEVVEKLANLSKESAFLRDQTLKKDDLLRDAHSKIVHMNKSLGQKQNEFVRLTKSSAMKLEILQRKVNELEKAVAKASETKLPTAAEKAENNFATEAKETIVRLEQALRAAENEKGQLNERASREQKKVTVLEQKYTTLYRDIGVKDKELSDLKAQLLKLKKEATAGAAEAKAAAASSGAQDGASAKLKESEARENVLKQELRKLAFKVENNEKNVKAIQQEADEKNKLLEQKLQAAKAKELELIKKVEDLSALLKKASKAA